MATSNRATGIHAFIFFVLASAISCITMFLSVRNPLGLEEAGTTALSYAAKFGPSFAGIIMAAAILGRDGVGDLIMRTLQWRARPGWYLFAFGIPIVASIIGAMYWYQQEENPPAIQYAAAITFVGWFLVRFLMGGGLGEELGWRGFMLPVLQDKWGPLRASLIVGICWGVWHYPAFFVDPNKMAPAGQIALLMIFFTVYSTVLSVIFTYLYNGSGGSIFLCIVIHATFNGMDSTLDQVIPGQEGDIPKAILLLLSMAIFIPLLIRQTRSQPNTS